MMFNSKVKSILESVKRVPKYELLTPERFTDVFILQLGSDAKGKRYYGMLYKVVKSTHNLSLVEPHLRDKAKFEIIKKTWRQVHLVSGWEIRSYGEKEDLKEVNKRVETMYIVNDSRDLPEWDLLDTYYLAFVKPSAFEETTGDVKDIFGDLYNEL